jgi:hypothetical protein
VESNSSYFSQFSEKPIIAHPRQVQLTQGIEMKKPIVEPIGEESCETSYPTSYEISYEINEVKI